MNRCGRRRSSRPGKSTGADLALDYRNEDVAARVLGATGGAGVDRVIEVDFAANIAAAMAAVRNGGQIGVYGSGKPEIALPLFPAIVRNLGIRFFIVYNLGPDDRAQAISMLTDWLEQGRLRHLIAARHPLDAIADAHEQVERGLAVGNVVIELRVAGAAASPALIAHRANFHCGGAEQSDDPGPRTGHSSFTRSKFTGRLSDGNREST